MKKNIPWKGLLMALILLLLAAGSIAIAWFAENPPDLTPDPPENSVGSTESGNSTEIKSITEGSLSSAVTDPEASDVTATESGTGTDTETNVTDTGSVTDTADTAAQTDEGTETTVTPPPSESTVPGTEPPPVDNSPKKVAFTFDDGPHATYTRAIADEFAKYGGKCTYFVIGNRVHGSQAGAMQYAAGLGHEIGIHGYTHKIYFNNCAEADYQYELQMTAEIIQGYTGIAPVLMRPPGGYLTDERTAACPYSVLLWNVDTNDWKYKKQTQANIDTIVQNVLSTVTDGDIILMHDIYSNTAEAVKILLPLLKEQGYEFVTVSELLGENRQPGTKYRYAY